MSRSLVDVLRDALKQMEQSTDYEPDDPAMLKLRQEITKAILKYETSKGINESPEPSSPFQSRPESS